MEEQKIIQVCEILARIDERVMSLHARFDKFEKSAEDTEKRVQSLERSQSRTMGAVSVVTAIAMVGLQKIMALIFGK